MTAFEEIRDEIRAAFLGSLSVDTVTDIENTICVILGKYDIKEKETSLTIYDAGDEEIVRRFFLAKAVQGCTQRTAKTYSSILLKFLSECGCHIKDVTPDLIRLYLAKKKIDKGSDSYLATIHRTLSSFYSWCTAEDIVVKNPMVKVEKIKIHKKVEDALTEEQMETLRYSARTKREKALVEFLYSTGCRIAEACALNRVDVNMELGEIEVLGKGRKYRKVYLTQRARFALQDYLNYREDKSPALFGYDLEPLIGGLKIKRIEEIGADGRLQPDEARTIIKNIGKRCGIKVHPHLLRKTVATLALKRGMPIDQVRAMLGHESVATTTIYAQTQDEEVKRSHEKFI